MLGLLRSAHPGTDLHYVGLDRFEGRLPEDPPGVTLKQAHQRLHGLARVQLVPGNVDTSLSRLCNHLGAFDLVLMDIQMSVMDGLTAMRKIREYAPFKDLPLVAMTAHVLAAASVARRVTAAGGAPGG
jgi:CheY-like chemotaxis protein